MTNRPRNITFPGPNAYYDALNPSDQVDRGFTVTLVRLDPYPDGDKKAYLNTPLGTLIIYRDGSWTILYRIVGRMLQIWATVTTPPADPV